ncbi:hypothetical protein UlMin_011184 [Ulmus minor]
MANVSQLNQFPCKGFSVTAPSVGIASRFTQGARISSREFSRNPCLGFSSPSTTTNGARRKTIRLGKARRLRYTSFPGLFPLLSRGTLPLVKVEEISQTIDSENFTVQNSVQFSGPLATTSISTNAIEVQSPKRVQFEEGIIGTPQLTDSIVVPENVGFLGQKIDLTPFKGILTSVQDTASKVFSTSNNNAQSWLLTTCLDGELRISRGDGGSVFVLVKEGSHLLTPWLISDDSSLLV